MSARIHLLYPQHSRRAYQPVVRSAGRSVGQRGRVSACVCHLRKIWANNRFRLIAPFSVRDERRHADRSIEGRCPSDVTTQYSRKSNLNPARSSPPFASCVCRLLLLTLIATDAVCGGINLFVVSMSIGTMNSCTITLSNSTPLRGLRRIHIMLRTKNKLRLFHTWKAWPNERTG